ncbi:hypothetical protein OF83DRAFT_283865 [Amylostereum chailletii]|nr:hypothetical protein OF83DRAFT_283865 [Amylostereum chailletii]
MYRRASGSRGAQPTGIDFKCWARGRRRGLGRDGRRGVGASGKSCGMGHNADYLNLRRSFQNSYSSFYTYTLRSCPTALPTNHIPPSLFPSDPNNVRLLPRQALARPPPPLRRRRPPRLGLPSPPQIPPPPSLSLSSPPRPPGLLLRLLRLRRPLRLPPLPHLLLPLRALTPPPHLHQRLPLVARSPLRPRSRRQGMDGAAPAPARHAGG